MGLIHQYTDYPSPPAQEPVGSSAAPEESSSKKRWLIIVAVGVIVLLAAFLLMSGGDDESGEETNEPTENTSSGESPSGDVSLEGNGVCDIGENCYDNPGDCPCEENEYCPKDTKQCVEQYCGNGICETGEYTENCCDDCGCATPDCEVCDTETHTCSVPEANISDAEVEEAIQAFYADAEYPIVEITLQGASCTYSQLSKSAVVSFEGMDFVAMVRVLESGEVVELGMT